MTLDRRVLILYAAAGAVCIKEFKKKKKNAFVSECVKRRQFPSFSVHRVH